MKLHFIVVWNDYEMIFLVRFIFRDFAYRDFAYRDFAYRGFAYRDFAFDFIVCLDKFSI